MSPSVNASPRPTERVRIERQCFQRLQYSQSLTRAPPLVPPLNRCDLLDGLMASLDLGLKPIQAKMLSSALKVTGAYPNLGGTSGGACLCVHAALLDPQTY